MDGQVSWIDGTMDEVLDLLAKHAVVCREIRGLRKQAAGGMPALQELWQKLQTKGQELGNWTTDKSKGLAQWRQGLRAAPAPDPALPFLPPPIPSSGMWDRMKTWAQDYPVAAGSLIGTGGGAVLGGLSSLFEEPEERHTARSAIGGALGGGAAGLGAGLLLGPGLFGRHPAMHIRQTLGGQPEAPVDEAQGQEQATTAAITANRAEAAGKTQNDWRMPIRLAQGATAGTTGAVDAIRYWLRRHLGSTAAKDVVRTGIGKMRDYPAATTMATTTRANMPPAESAALKPLPQGKGVVGSQAYLATLFDELKGRPGRQQALIRAALSGGGKPGTLLKDIEPSFAGYPPGEVPLATLQEAAALAKKEFLETNRNIRGGPVSQWFPATEKGLLKSTLGGGYASRLGNWAHFGGIAGIPLALELALRYGVGFMNPEINHPELWNKTTPPAAP